MDIDIAHVRKNEDGSWADPHSLLLHLHGTAEKAEAFASVFHSGDWGRALGLAHDAGKGRKEWQNYLKRTSSYDIEAHLEGKPGKIPHAIYGAGLVEQFFGKGKGRLLAYGIAGHHAGLQDWSDAEGAGQASLQYQLSKTVNFDDVSEEIKDLIRKSNPAFPTWKYDRKLDLSLWIRMLYSCLVDADFLDTEEYMNPNRSSERGGYLTLDELKKRFDDYIYNLEQGSPDSIVNIYRREIRETCIRMANEPPGMFSLSVPTGGGKTLSSLAFALVHAKKHKLDRIIYVIPYTSIIEQTADIFRKAVGHDQVIEHHSNLDQEDDSPKSRLSAENWDAPIVVTTSVQFFESLFSSKSSSSRKLHNIAASVVVLDEAQLIPSEYLNPILETMQLLVDRYKVSFVISTATQPAFHERMVDGLKFSGLKNMREIMGNQSEVQLLYQAMVRNRVEFPEDVSMSFPLEDLAEELKTHQKVLCIVSDRKSCRELHQLMPEGAYHLSTLMCGLHRSEVIQEIKDKLKENVEVRVISTQLVEAGVDLDFPVVYRSFAGLDSIAQAAGRCNREGKLPSAIVKVFILPRPIPKGILRKAADATKAMLVAGSEGLMEYDSFSRYFERLYSSVNSLDLYDIAEKLKPDSQECGIYFRAASKKFKLIDDSNQKTILVRYKEGISMIDQLRARGPDRDLLRRLQRYSITIYEQEFYDLLERGVIEEAVPGLYALSTDLDYSKQTGLILKQTCYDPEQFIL